MAHNNAPPSPPQIRLVYASHTPEDIILKTELDALSVVHRNFKVLYIVTQPGEGAWRGATGHVSKDMITSFLPPPQPEAGRHGVLVCGPPGFMKAVSGEKKSQSEQGELTGMLAELSYSAAQTFKF